MTQPAREAAPRPQEPWLNFLLPLALILGLVLLLNLNTGQAPSDASPSTPLEPWLKVVASYLAAGAEIAAAFVIGVAIVRAIWNYLRQTFAPHSAHLNYTESIRLRLGRALALGLEFTVASDILRTA